MFLGNLAGVPFLLYPQNVPQLVGFEDEETLVCPLRCQALVTPSSFVSVSNLFELAFILDGKGRCKHGV
jgi:hypothetical protein